MILHRLLDSIRSIVGRRRFEREMDAELRAHLEHRVDDLISQGVDPVEARRRARADFGSLVAVKDDARAARGIRWVDELRQDLRYTLRALSQAPGYATVGIVTLALGIGATTAIFSVVDGVLLKPLPFPESDRLVRVGAGYPLGALWTYRTRAASYEAVAAYGYSSELNLFAAGRAERIKGRAVSAEFFSVLGTVPLSGRTFRPGEDGPGAAPVAVVSEGLWRRRLGADRSIVGSRILVDGAAREVIGVMPSSFAFPTIGTELWIPVDLDPGPNQHSSVWGAGGTTLVGRLRPGVTIARADAEHRSLITTVRDSYPWRMPDRFGQGPANRVDPLDDVMARGVRDRLTLLLAAVATVLLVACANLATLNLTRLAGREREIAVRQALGGSRLRVGRQLVVEQLVIATIGGALGLGLAIVGRPILIWWLPPDTPRLDQVVIDPRVVAFTTLVIVVAGLLSAIGPLIRLPASGAAQHLTAGSRRVAGGRRQSRLSAIMVGVEVSLAVVLVIGAGILLRSLGRLLSVDPGVSVERLTTVRVTPNPIWCERDAGPCTCPTGGTKCRPFFPVFEEALAATASIRAVGMGNTVPLDGGYFSFPMEIEDHPVPAGGSAHLLGTHVVSPDYFRVMGIPLLAGRVFTPADRLQDQPVVVVSRTLAQRYWPGQSALGKHIKPVWMPKQATVVGLVADVRYETLSAAEPTADFYMPMAQWAVPSMTAVIESPLSPSALEKLVRQVVTGIDPTATVTDVRTMRSVVLASAAPAQTTSTLIGAFAALALLLGAVGVYGVLSYNVAQRRRELGIRLAVGARPRALRLMVLGDALRLLGGGVVAGLVLAWIGASALDRFVFGVTARDPLTFALGPVVFAVVGLAAGYLPARRATRVDPTEVLRAD